MAKKNVREIALSNEEVNATPAQTDTKVEFLQAVVEQMRNISALMITPGLFNSELRKNVIDMEDAFEEELDEAESEASWGIDEE